MCREHKNIKKHCPKAAFSQTMGHDPILGRDILFDGSQLAVTGYFGHKLINIYVIFFFHTSIVYTA